MSRSPSKVGPTAGSSVGLCGHLEGDVWHLLAVHVCQVPKAESVAESVTYEGLQAQLGSRFLF